MKPVLALKTILVFAYLLFFYSCSSDNTTTTLPPPPVNLDDCGDVCDYLKKNGNNIISEECADCMRLNFAKNNYSFPPLDSAHLKGFRFNNKEIKSLYDSINVDSANIYGMFGLYYGPDKAGSKIKIKAPHQIFVLEKIETNGFSYTYYDFVRPCPNFCPDYP